LIGRVVHRSAFEEAVSALRDRQPSVRPRR
jgi:hypothetical protein